MNNQNDGYTTPPLEQPTPLHLMTEYPDGEWRLFLCNVLTGMSRRVARPVADSIIDQGIHYEQNYPNAHHVHASVVLDAYRYYHHPQTCVVPRPFFQARTWESNASDVDVNQYIEFAGDRLENWLNNHFSRNPVVLNQLQGLRLSLLDELNVVLDELNAGLVDDVLQTIP